MNIINNVQQNAIKRSWVNQPIKKNNNHKNTTKQPLKYLLFNTEFK